MPHGHARRNTTKLVPTLEKVWKESPKSLIIRQNHSGTAPENLTSIGVFPGDRAGSPYRPQRKIQIVPTGRNVAVKGHAEARVVPPEKGIPHVADVYFRINCVVGAVVVDLPQYLLVDVCQFLRMLSGLG